MKDIKYYDCVVKDIIWGYHSYSKSTFCKINFSAPEFESYVFERSLQLFLNRPFDAKILELLYERVFGCPTFTYRDSKDIIGTKVKVGVTDLDTFVVKDINGINFDYLRIINRNVISHAVQSSCEFADTFIVPDSMKVVLADKEEDGQSL